MAAKDQTIGNNMVKCGIRTKIKMHEITMTVENVSKMSWLDKLNSPEFYLTPECMCCICFAKAQNNLFVYISNKSDNDIKITRTLVLSDYNDKKLHEQRDAKIFLLKKEIDVDLIGNVQNRKSYDTLTNDTLIINLCISIEEIVSKNKNIVLCDINPEKKLREDFKTMLDNPINFDVTLKVGDQRVPAHWSVLCSRSPYFKRMFDSEMLEKVNNSITITDLSLCTVKKLIEFLYTANFVPKDDIQELFDLYYAADKYEVMDLRTLCGYKIIDIATADNLSQILLFAHRHNDKDLQKTVMECIQRQSEAVFQTDGWKKFETSEPLVAEVIRFFCIN